MASSYVAAPPINYGSIPSPTQLMSGQLVSQWDASHRKETISVIEISGAGPVVVGSGTLNGSATGTAASLSTGATLKSFAGWQFPKHTGCCTPGSSHYHYVNWPKLAYVSFRFGIATTIAGTRCLMGGYGTDLADVPWADSGGGVLYGASWLPYRSCVWFIIDSTGALSIGISTETAASAVIYPTSAVVNVTGAAAVLVQEILYQFDGLGNVSIFLNNNPVPVITLSGVMASESNNDNYPFMGVFNESTGTGHAQDFLAFPLEVTTRTS